MRTTIKAKLLAVSENLYTTYVFQNLDEPEESLFRYIMVTRCPNWQYFDTIHINDIGYLLFEEAQAGDTYVLPTGETGVYKHTNTYFINFIKEKQEDNNRKEFKF